MIRQSIHLVASLDVEEEGLFRNGYSLAVHQPVSNVKSLIRLAPLLRLGLRPTLFCDNAVFENDPAWASVEDMAARYPLEIGAHMHHWNTPPIVLEGTETHSVPSSSLTAAQFSAKLDHLLEAGRKRIGRRPSSFRMGRWDIRQEHWPLLAEAGIQRDASVRPLHAPDAGHTRPDHFSAPSEPYLIPAAGRTIVELPLTVTPLLRCLPELTQRLSPALFRRYQQWGALALLPVYHPLWAMKASLRCTGGNDDFPDMALLRDVPRRQPSSCHSPESRRAPSEAPRLHCLALWQIQCGIHDAWRIRQLYPARAARTPLPLRIRLVSMPLTLTHHTYMGANR